MYMYVKYMYVKLLVGTLQLCKRDTDGVLTTLLKRVKQIFGSLITFRSVLRTPQFFCVRKYAKYALIPTSQKMSYLSY